MPFTAMSVMTLDSGQCSAVRRVPVQKFRDCRLRKASVRDGWIGHDSERATTADMPEPKLRSTGIAK